MECGMTSKVIQTDIERIKDNLKTLDTDSLVIIVDLNVQNIYSKVLKLLNIEGKKVTLWKAPPGENAKNFEEFERCIEFIIEKGIHRKSHIVAIGGGAISDFAGFVASTVLRGITWSIVPTTLLSMIDASIGGKVGINSQFGKNLVGNFHLPDNIFIAREFLSTLSDDEYQSGLGELLKYCFLDSNIASKLRSQGDHRQLISECMNYKHKVVERDLKESGLRKVLNFGHTFGHAIEAHGKYKKILHGEAVAKGMKVASRISFLENLMSEKEYRKAIALLEMFEFDLSLNQYNYKELEPYIYRDKKIKAGRLNIVLLNRLSNAIVTSSFDAKNLKKGMQA
jgi:3-dehydroquinate synthase